MEVVFIFLFFKKGRSIKTGNVVSGAVKVTGEGEASDVVEEGESLVGAQGRGL